MTELIDAVKARFDQEGVGGLADWIYELVIDTVEPIIRADEVDRRFGWVTQEDARAWFLADLRTKVEAVRVVESRVKGRRITVLVDRADVLALLEEKP